MRARSGKTIAFGLLAIAGLEAISPLAGAVAASLGLALLAPPRLWLHLFAVLAVLGIVLAASGGAAGRLVPVRRPSQRRRVS